MELKPYEIIEKVVLGAQMGAKLFEMPHISWLAFKVGKLFLFDHENRLNQSGRFGFQKAGSGVWTPSELSAYKYDCKATYNFFSRILKARDNNKPVVWLDWPVPVEIVKGFDVAAFVPESFMAIANMVGTDGHVACLEAVEREGISDDICAMDRVTIGAYLLEQMPKPTAIISIAHPCDAGRTTNQIFEYMTGAPSYAVNTSYTKDDEDIDLYSKNLIEAIHFLEDILDQKYDWDKLRDMVTVLNQQNYYLNEVTQMNRNIPSPGLGINVQTAWGSKIPGAGDPNLLESAKITYKIGKFRIKYPYLRKRIEKFRIIVGDMPIVFTELMKWIEVTYGGVLVADYIGDAIFPTIDTSTKESMIKGVAQDRLYMGMIKQAHGKANETLDDLERQIEGYSADCIIFFGHQGCKHNLALQRIVKDTCKRHAVPYLMLEADIFDKRVMSEYDIKRALTNFFISHGLA
jgi:benzoyl-CoA reductase/2-hydroxyglutaryl-CoA dehydratase subunit BcrC/BadD/HgdB